MRKFADLHLLPPVQDTEAVEGMASLAAEIGFWLVGMTFDLRISKDTRLRMTRPFENRGLRTLSRIDLRPKSRKELLGLLRVVRGTFDIVAVECSNAQLSSLAFRDRRIDLVFFTPDRLHTRLSWLMPRRSKRPIELNIADLLRHEPAPSLSLQRAFNVATEAHRRGIPMVVSSGAKDPMGMRTPRDMAAILSVLNSNATQAIDSVSSIPFSLAHAALSRHELGFITEASKVVKVKS